MLKKMFGQVGELTFKFLVLPKGEAKKLLLRDKKRFLMLTNMLRDMDLFRKLLIYAKEEDLGNRQLSQSAYVTLVFAVSKVLMSKEFEIWKFFKGEAIGDEKNSFTQTLRQSWDKIEVFFNDEKNEKLFSFVRNKFGFHFDHFSDVEPYIESAMQQVGDLEFWLSTERSGNDIYASSNTIMLTVLCNKMRELGFSGDDLKMVEQLHKFTIDMAHVINEFCKEYLIEVVLKGVRFEDRQTTTVLAPLLSKVSLPLLVKNN